MTSSLNDALYINNDEQMHIVDFESTKKFTHRPTLSFGLAKMAVVKPGGIRYQTIIVLSFIFTRIWH